jgi:hypothetical protein
MRTRGTDCGVEQGRARASHVGRVHTYQQERALLEIAREDVPKPEVQRDEHRNEAPLAPCLSRPSRQCRHLSRVPYISDDPSRIGVPYIVKDLGERGYRLDRPFSRHTVEANFFSGCQVAAAQPVVRDVPVVEEPCHASLPCKSACTACTGGKAASPGGWRPFPRPVPRSRAANSST